MKPKNRIKLIIDSVPHLPMFRADANEGIFAQHLVRETLRELFTKDLPERKWVNGGLIAMPGGVSAGAREYSYMESEGKGSAKIVADNATDIPMADLDGQLNLLPVKTVATSIRYSRQDVRSAQMQGLFDVVQQKSMAAREANDLALDDLIRSGHGPSGLRGIVNHPGIVVQNAITGSWQTATAAQIVGDVTTALNAMMNSTDNVEVPDTVIMDVASYTRISTLQNSTASDITVLDYLRRAFPMVRRWDWEPGLRMADAAGTGPAMLAYRNDASKVRAVVPMLMQPTPPEQRGLSFVINFETRFGGVMAPKPRSILRLDGI